ncbi:enoyl-CoA hydratase-related protein [Pseudogemmobacter bohemicus]|uniref:enoyl-CoA hydratase-related protein n=1 Tax=Pseudogemmobacter bohemicus TaxID=2250708 RepID=UPI000DD35AEE|nr:enoyl-CoA hydratase-related protein [Pseudogemmobacter bohemicus]
MTWTCIRSRIEAGVATITLNRPDVMNALSSQMRRELCEALDEAGDARVIVLTGEGRAFCSGQDLADAKDIAAVDFETILNEEYVPLLRRITDAPVPVIAAVNGAAAGAGANIALACDVVIAAESAVFIQAFARIGLIPDAGGTHWLPRKVGLARAMGAALFADKISARQAADWGMIWEAVPDADFTAVVAARAAHLANGPTRAYRAVKQALRASFALDLAAALEVEARLQGDLGQSGDFREGVAAFLEKRPARFTGA